MGRVGRAHGIRGEVIVATSTDDPEERFASGAVLLTDPPDAGPLTVTDARAHSGRLLARFAGVEDRTAAEGLRGVRLFIEVAAGARPADPEEYYDHELIGLAARTAAGQAVGEVARVLHLPGQDVLVVRRPDASEALVPFVAALVPAVDLAARRVVLDLPPGLLDLNRPEPPAAHLAPAQVPEPSP